jgi:hypothetical protein
MNEILLAISFGIGIGFIIIGVYMKIKGIK